MKYLVIGLGSMGKRRIRNLLALGERDVTGYDVVENRRKEAGEKYMIATIGDLSPSVLALFDAFIISTPPNLHAPYIRLAIEHDKHLFVEATTSDEAYADVLRLPAGRVRVPSCTMRFFEPISKIKELVDQGAIGKILAYQYHMGQYLPDWHPWEDYRQVYFAQKETGACREMLPFELHWLTWIIGAPVSHVCGYTEHLSSLEMSADDCYLSSVRHANNVCGNLLIDVIARVPFRTLRLLGTDSVLEWEWQKHEIVIRTPDASKTQTLSRNQGTSERGYITVEDMYIGEMDAFLKAVRGEASFPYSFQEDARNLRALYAMEKASRDGKYGDVHDPSL